MENRIEEVKDFEIKLRTLMKGYISDYSDMVYIICYLCLIDSKLEGRPNNNFEEEYIRSDINTFYSFLYAAEEKFKKLDCGPYKKYIEEALNYLKDFKYGNINGKELLDLLKTKDIYFYEYILRTNALGCGNINYPARCEATPNELIKLFDHFKRGNNYLDVGCGNGNTLIGLSNESNQINNLDGIEKNNRNVLISKLRMSIVHNAESNIIEGDYLTKPINKKYSYITINMSLGEHIKEMQRNELMNLKNQYRFDWKINPSASPEWVYVNKALNLLEKSGRIALIALQTVLYKNGDIKLRKDLIDNNLIEYVIDMPAGTYPNSMVKYSIIIFNNNKKDDCVKFIDASEYYIKQRINSKIDVEKLINIIETGEKTTTVKNSTIAENDYILSTMKYANESNMSKLENATKLSDLKVIVTRGYQFFSKSDVKQDGKYSIITISDIDENGNLNDELGKFNTDKDVDKYLLKENDILIATKGTRIKTYLVENLKDKNTIYHGNLTLIRVEDEKLNPVYLKLYLDSERGQLDLKAIQTGATIISINTSQLSNIEIPLINIEKQNKIVNDYINKKEEINNLTNKLNNLKNELTNLINKSFEYE